MKNPETYSEKQKIVHIKFEKWYRHYILILHESVSRWLPSMARPGIYRCALYAIS